jgi:hypothetical protein
MLAPDRPDGITELRDLVAMRAVVGAVIEAVDRVPIEAERSGRTVVADDGEWILQTFYSESGVVAAADGRIGERPSLPTLESTDRVLVGHTTAHLHDGKKKVMFRGSDV